MADIRDLIEDRKDAESSRIFAQSQLASAMQDVRWLTTTAYFADVRRTEPVMREAVNLLEKAAALEAAAMQFISAAHLAQVKILDAKEAVIFGVKK
jgi:hypothetical protein